MPSMPPKQRPAFTSSSSAWYSRPYAGSTSPLNSIALTRFSARVIAAALSRAASGSERSKTPEPGSFSSETMRFNIGKSLGGPESCKIDLAFQKAMLQHRNELSVVYLKMPQSRAAASASGAAGHAPHYRQYDASNETRTYRGREEHVGGRHFFRLCRPFHVGAAAERRDCFGRPVGRIERRPDRPRCDRIDTD